MRYSVKHDKKNVSRAAFALEKSKLIGPHILSFQFPLSFEKDVLQL